MESALTGRLHNADQTALRSPASLPQLRAEDETLWIMSDAGRLLGGKRGGCADEVDLSGRPPACLHPLRENGLRS